MRKNLVLLLFIFLSLVGKGQLVEVRADYNAVGDCIFTAINNAPTPIYLNIDFADLQNTAFNETLPYIKKLSPGFNSLFSLPRYPDADVPRFNYEIRSYRSDPFANVNLDFPYLVPFKPGTEIIPVEIKNIDGFWGNEVPESWKATGFNTAPGTAVFASRKGEIVEISGASKSGDPQFWYHAWTNSITLLQPDGTLICYKNVADKAKKWKMNDIVQAGELLGEIVPGATELVMLIYKNSLASNDLSFIIPQFQIAPDLIQMVHPALKIEVVHPEEIRGLEMSKKEIRKYLNSK